MQLAIYKFITLNIKVLLLSKKHRKTNNNIDFIFYNYRNEISNNKNIHHISDFETMEKQNSYIKGKKGYHLRDF